MISGFQLNNCKLNMNQEKNSKVKKFYKIKITQQKNENERQKCLVLNKNNNKNHNFNYTDENLKQKIQPKKAQTICLRKKKNKFINKNTEKEEDYHTENIIIFNNNIFWGRYQANKSQIKHYKALSQSIKKRAITKKRRSNSSSNIKSYHRHNKLTKTNNFNTSDKTRCSLKRIGNHFSQKQNRIIKIYEISNENYYNNNYFNNNIYCNFLKENQIISDVEVGQKRHGKKAVCVSILNSEDKQNISLQTPKKSINSHKNIEKGKLTYNPNYRSRNSVINQKTKNIENSKSKKNKNKGKIIIKSPVKKKFNNYLNNAKKFVSLNSTINKNMNKNTRKIGIVEPNKMHKTLNINLHDCTKDNTNCFFATIEKNDSIPCIKKKKFTIYNIKSDSKSKSNQKQKLSSNIKNRMNLQRLSQNLVNTSSIITKNYETIKYNTTVKENKKNGKLTRKKIKNKLINKK